MSSRKVPSETAKASPDAAEYHLTIQDLPEGERPRERLEHYGADALSNAELLAILLRTGLVHENVLQVATTAAGTIRRSDGTGAGRLPGVVPGAGARSGEGDANKSSAGVGAPSGRDFSGIQAASTLSGGCRQPRTGGDGTAGAGGAAHTTARYQEPRHQQPHALGRFPERQSFPGRRAVSRSRTCKQRRHHRSTQSSIGGSDTVAGGTYRSRERL